LPIARFLVPTLLLVLVVISSALCQSRLPGEAHAEIATMTVAPTYAPPVSLPVTRAPQKARVIDKKFVAVMVALAAAESLRFTTHKLVLDNEYAAGAPWVTSVPPNQRLIAKYAGIYAAELPVIYELKKPHAWLPGDRFIRKFWWAYPTVMVPIHIKNGVRGIRTQAPSCRVDECQAP
jgi:hypothetical protein